MDIASEKALIPLADQAGWEACNERNSTGYGMIGKGVVLLIGTTLLDRAFDFLPSW